MLLEDFMIEQRRCLNWVIIKIRSYCFINGSKGPSFVENGKKSIVCIKFMMLQKTTLYIMYLYSKFLRKKFHSKTSANDRFFISVLDCIDILSIFIYNNDWIN